MDFPWFFSDFPGPRGVFEPAFWPEAEREEKLLDPQWRLRMEEAKMCEAWAPQEAGAMEEKLQERRR